MELVAGGTFPCLLHEIAPV